MGVDEGRGIIPRETERWCWKHVCIGCKVSEEGLVLHSTRKGALWTTLTQQEQSRFIYWYFYWFKVKPQIISHSCWHQSNQIQISIDYYLMTQRFTRSLAIIIYFTSTNQWTINHSFIIIWWKYYFKSAGWYEKSINKRTTNLKLFIFNNFRANKFLKEKISMFNILIQRHGIINRKKHSFS